MVKFINMFLEMNNVIIDIHSLDINLKNIEVFKNINLKINKGDFIYLIGDTGSGKSSLLKAIYAEIKAPVGKISVAGIDLTKIKKKSIPKLRRKLGIVFQDFQLLTDRNVSKNLEFVLKATGWKNNKEIEKRINKVLKSVYLENVKDKMPYELSGGEQQRASIARALLNNPEIIIADEPTGNLDPRKSEKIIELLKEINQNGTTILIATHDYHIIKKYKSRTIKCGNLKLIEVEPEHL